MKAFFKSTEKPSDFVWVRYFYVSSWGTMMMFPKESTQELYTHIYNTYSCYKEEFWDRATFSIIDGDRHIEVNGRHILEELGLVEKGGESSAND